MNSNKLKYKSLKDITFKELENLINKAKKKGAENEDLLLSYNYILNIKELKEVEK